MARFENKKEMKKIRPVKYTWYNWLINYIPESIRKSAGGFKDKILKIKCLFKTNTPKWTANGRGKKLSKLKKNKTKQIFLYQKRTKKNRDKITEGIWILFATEEKEKERN